MRQRYVDLKKEIRNGGGEENGCRKKVNRKKEGEDEPEGDKGQNI